MSVVPVAELIERLGRRELLTPQQLSELKVWAEGVDSSSRFADELIRRRWLTPFQVEHLLSDRLGRLELGGYRLVEPIGAGGMGEVFLGRQKKLNRDVAVKLIRADIAASHSEALGRFRREALAVARLSHPNIVHIYDADEVDGTHFIVMEYVRGVDLARLVSERGPLPIPVACDFIRQAALGLQHAHENGLVHRDVKPSNLLVSIPEGPGAVGYGLVKLLDLGLVRLDGESGDLVLTRHRGVLGTPDFISPEQASDARRADIRSDLYSMGCTLYYLLSGQPPFPNGTGIEKIMCHRLERPQAIHLLRPGVPADVQSVMGKLLKKEPNERYQTPAELAGTLAEMLNKMTRPINWPPRINPVLPPPPPPPARSLAGVSIVPRTEQVAPPLFASGAAAAAGAAGAAGLMQATRLSILGASMLPAVSRLGAAPAPPSMLLSPGVLPPASMLPSPSIAPSPSPQPSGSTRPPSSASSRSRGRKSDSSPSCRVIKASSIPDLGAASALPSVTAARIAVLQGHNAPVMSMAFAARGRFLATGGLDHAVRVWRLHGEETRQETAFQDDRLGEIRAMAFLPASDDLILAASGMGGRILRWTWQGGQAQGLAPLDQSPGASVLAVSPDGAFVAAGRADKVHVWAAVRGTLKPCGLLTGRGRDITALAFFGGSRSLLAGDDQGRLMSWSQSRRRFHPTATFIAHSGPITVIAASPDERHMASASSDNTLRGWSNIEEFEPLFTVTVGLRGVVRRLQFDSDGSTLLAVSDAGQVTGWQSLSGEPVSDWRLNQPVSTSQAMADHGGLVAIGRTDGDVIVHQLRPASASSSGSRSRR